MLVFEKKTIVLDLPAGTGAEPKVVNGWKILPLTYPEVKHTLMQMPYTCKISLYMYIV